MKRSILFSLLVIGAVVAVVASAGTFAPFTDTASDSGTITATTIDIQVLGTGTLDFELQGTSTDCDDIVPGAVCDDLVTVTNNGTVTVTLAAPVSSEAGALEGCATGDSLSTVVSAYSGDGVLGAGGSETFTITTTFSPGGGQAAVDGCQGLTGTVTVSVTATS